jgi:putative membrane protein
MAWIRTTFSMISFGFTIYKFMQVYEQQNAAVVLKQHAPRNVGLTLVGIGTLALIVACIQHFRFMKSLSPGQSYKFWVDLSLIMAALLGLLGLLMFGSMMFEL